MSIEVSSLTKKYGEQTAVNDVSFAIKTGEIVGFLGPNGAGKSTTMKIITGYLSPTSGSASVCGIDVLAQPLETKKIIGYLPEHNPLYLDMYVREFLNFAAQASKINNKNAAIAEVVEKTGLGPERHKKIGQLSKGYRQRVGLAQALIHKPKVLILDEPTSGLDPNQVVDIRRLIMELGKEQTVMLSTHIMQEVEAMCSRVIIINQGKIIANDETSRIKNLLQQENVVKVSFKNPVPLSIIKNFYKWSDVTQLADNSFSLRAPINVEIAEIVFNLAKTHNLIVTEQQEQKDSLEQIFQKLTKKNA